MRRCRPVSLIALALLSITAAPVFAQSSATEALLQQARYWLEHDRPDRANEAYRRLLAIDPNNAEARAALTRAEQPARPARVTPAPAPAPLPPTPVRVSPAPSATPAPTSQFPRWSAADDRAAGFRYLERDELERAAQQFLTALRRRANDPESLGGLGVVRLRQGQFAEARDLLARASDLGDASQWLDALRSARFFAGLESARDALDAGQLASAQQQAEALARSDYDDLEPALLLLAEVYEKQERYADAADILEQARDDDADAQQRLMSRAARNRALEAARLGDDIEAENQFLTGLMLDPVDPWIRYEFARYLIQRDRRPEVESMLAALAGIGTPEAYYAAALLSDQLERPDQAQAFVDRIPPAQRSSLVAGFAAGLAADREIAGARLLAAQGRRAEAVARLRDLAGSTGLGAQAKADLAVALLDLGDEQGAANVARNALASGGLTSVEAYEPLVRALARAGLETDARMALERARSLAGPSLAGQQQIDRLTAVLASARADRLRLQGQFADAFDVLQSAWTTAPGSTDVLLELALLYQSGQMPAQAAQTYQLFLVRKPDDTGALTGLVRTAAAAGDRPLATATLERALVVAPQDYEVYLAAADMEQSLGNRRRALAYLDTARTLYGRQGGLAIDSVTEANPFVASTVGRNPFRTQATAASAAAINPFELSRDTRLPGQGITMAGGEQGAIPGTPSGSGLGVPAVGPNTLAAGAARAGPGSLALQMPSGDPVLQRIEEQRRSLEQDTGPRADLQVGYRERSGEEGLSALRELTASPQLSIDLGPGRLAAGAEFVVLDAGQPARSALARFGTNATPEAQAIVDQVPSPLAPAETQHASGIAPFAEYSDDQVTLRIGSTPLGFDHREVTWRAEARPPLPPGVTGRVWIENLPVTDSVVAYAGARDPVTGRYWGEVIARGGGIAMSRDVDGSGVYADAAYHRYSGQNVRDNTGVEANVGGYLLAYSGTRTRVTAGLNLNYQDYENNQNFFTFGHGGYFSPQSFLAVAVPLRYTYTGDRLQVDVDASPGFQSYEQRAEPLYPTEDAAQAQLDALKLANDDVRSYYDSISKTGMAFAGGINARYKILPQTSIGGEVRYNGFGNYSEFSSLLSVRQELGTTQRGR